MTFRKTLDQFNIVKQCRKYNLPFWQCPQFLFLIMGIIIIFFVLFIYFVGRNYIEDPLAVAFLVTLIGLVLFIIAFIITRSFERLVEINRMKSEFVNIVSHQLRSPLSNLKWIIELLMSGKISSDSEKQVEYLGTLKENSDRMRELISDLLIVSRIEQQKLSLKKEKVSLVDLIKKAIRETEAFAKDSNVKIDFNWEKNSFQTLTDPFHFKLIIGKLLDNAIRYIKKEGKVEIFLKKKDDNFYLEIKDNGIGIPKKDQKYIFQNFFRSENVKRHQVGGSGLDLYITKSIIKKLGGKIGFKSQEGVGSTFWLRLPVKQ